MLMFSEIEKKYLQRCFDLAQLGNGSTSPNPCVGSVIVYDNEIIGEGWHQYYGGAHAEVNAVASIPSSKRHLLPMSTIYVSLEPCFHFAKTPPCVDLILKENIRHVVVAFKDPNPKVAGQSIKKLHLNGIPAKILYDNNNTKSENFIINKQAPHAFFTNILHERPYIILKWAETADGFLGKIDEQTPISNELSKRLVHKWRSECDGIMIGRKTAETDNPKLNNRYYFGKSPVRIVLDRTNRLDSSLHLFDNTLKTFVYCEKQQPNIDNTVRSEGIPMERDSYVQRTPFGGEGGNFVLKKGENIEINNLKFDDNLLNNIMTDLLSKKIGILLVEGGAALLNSFIEKNLWDEARVIKSTTSLFKNKNGRFTSHEGVVSPQIAESYKQDSILLDDNTVTFYKNF